MTFDVRTLFLANMIIYGINIFAIAMLWQNNANRYKGLFQWLLSIVLVFIGNLLIMFRGSIPDFFSIWLANVIIMIAFQINVYGLVKFFLLKYRFYYHVFFGLFYTALFTYYTYLEPNLNARNGLIGFLGLFTFGSMFIYIHFDLSAYFKRITRQFEIVLILFMIGNLIRIIYAIIDPTHHEDIFLNHPRDVLSNIFVSVFAIILPLAFIILVNKRALDEVDVEEAKFKSAFDNSPVIMIISRLSSGEIYDVNKAFLDTFELSRDFVIGKTTAQIKIWGSDNQRREELLKRIAKREEIEHQEMTFFKMNGDPVETIYSCRVIRMFGDDFLLSTASDTTLLGRAKRELIYIATHDALTGLLNRHELEHYYQELKDIYTTELKPFSVILIDLDRFKAVNDTYGHNIGDDLLILISRKLSLVFKDHFVARLGGDEFIILLKNLNQETEIIKYMIKARNEITNLKSIEDKPIDIGASIGFSIYPKDGLYLEDLVRQADKMMYKEKDSKRRV
ncbi:sensor domain-containing diguanylate cyclase [Acholeplasma manati]|uniref:Sensor domain-containing diguanylate cyclase n=1 Tax=Paracholeplasma manati TaxID=591373 RepID=A0ABT2Y5Z3_9MOLU|nr:sensor domain-containing diguanylate cyclase [Paracholeplasma manati]MCV2231868.1 sensor domain-containing diguanylate cyclase [Paracholeplasma manati]